MKTLFTIVLQLTLNTNSWSQESVKDTLFFKFNCNYITVKKSYENIHVFFFKKEKLVSSAFGKRIVEETFFHFAQFNGDARTYNFKPRKIHNLKKYLEKRLNIFRDKSTKRYDAYKMTKYFDNYVVFFLNDEKFVKISANATLGE